MDSWTSEQVDVSGPDRRMAQELTRRAKNMRSHGNNISNKIYNPRNVKPPIATDADEEDACMERFIRQKYQHRTLEDGKPKPPSRHNSDHSRSPEGSPPPLPPKTGKIFSLPGLRSSSSAANLRQPSSNKGPAFSPRSEGRGSLSPSNTGSQGMGASVAEIGTASFASKLTTLREMGFPDDRRNAVILKGLSGDIEKTVDSLVRLGEGSHPASGSRTPATTASHSSGGAAKQGQTTSTNPFDQLDANPPSQPSGRSYNPFDMPAPQSASAQPQSLESSFQNLQVSQPLFPHSTGGYPPQHSFSQPLPQQSATPPVQSTFTQGSFVSSPQSVDGSYNPFSQPAQPQASPAFAQSPGAGQNNPFFSRISPQATSMGPQTQTSASTSVPSVATPNMPRHANTMPTFSSTSPFGPSPFQQQQQQQFPSSQFQNPNNPFQSMTAPTTPQSAGYEAQYQQPGFQSSSQNAVYSAQYQQQGLQPTPQNAGYEAQFQQPGLQPAPQPLAPQATGRVDKGSILALYNFSPPPPAISEQPQQQHQPNTVPAPSTGPTLQPQSTSAPQNPQPLGGSRNPFLSSGQPGPQPQTRPQPFRSHSSQPSVDVSGFQNGRHSPDAFASLSARYG